MKGLRGLLYSDDSEIIHTVNWSAVFLDIQIRKEIVEFQAQAVPPKEEGEKVEEEAVTDESTSNSLIGSLSAQYGGDTSILYHQMDLHTREEKINQIILLQVTSSYICVAALILPHVQVLSQSKLLLDSLSVIYPSAEWKTLISFSFQIITPPLFKSLDISVL